MKSSQLEELQTKLAFLEDALNQLSDEHYQQQKELDALKLRVSQLSKKVVSDQGLEDNSESPEDQRPPHY